MSTQRGKNFNCFQSIKIQSILFYSNNPTSRKTVSVKKLIFSKDWDPVKDLFTLEKLKCVILYLTLPIWLPLKVLIWLFDAIGGVTLTFAIIGLPWPLIKFAFSNLFLASFDIYSDVIQGVKFIR